MTTYRNQIIFGLAVTLMASSCSIFHSTKSTTVVADTSQKPSIKTEKPIESPANTDDITTNKVISELPTRSISSDIESKMTGEWTIISVYNKKITALDMPFINFDFDTKKIFGNNGCNVINGDFVVSEQNKSLKISNVITSLISCPDYKLEATTMRAISEVAGYNLVTIKGIIHLNLLDNRGGTILQLKRHNLNDINGAWTVKNIDGKPINDENIKLVIDVQELKIHGNSGCNIINGTVSLDPNKDFAIQFQQIVSTRKMCPNLSTEIALLVALEEVESYKRINSNEIVFYNYKKELTLTLTRLDLTK